MESYLKWLNYLLLYAIAGKKTVLIPIGTALRKSTVRIIANVMCMAKRTHGKEVVGQALARLIYVLHYFTFVSEEKSQPLKHDQSQTLKHTLRQFTSSFPGPFPYPAGG